MGPAAILDIILRAETGQATSALSTYNRSISKAESSHASMTKSVEKNNKRMGVSFSGLAKGVLAAGGAFEAFSLAKEAIKSTMELGVATHRLSAATGMDTKASSQWIEAAKVRHVTSTALAMSFVTLSKNIRNAEDSQTKGNAAVVAAIKADKEQVAALKATGASHAAVTALEKNQADALVVLKAKSSTVTDAFKELGVSQDLINKGDPSAVIKSVADGLAKVENPARRAALAQQIFGRAGRNLLPMLAEGSKGIDTALAATERYGAYLPKNAAQLEKARVAQQNLNLAMDGLKISFTEAVLPALVSGAGKLMDFISQMRQGKGAGGAFASAISSAFKTVKGVVTSVVGAVGGLGNAVKIMIAAFAISKVLAFGTAIAKAFAAIEAATGPVGLFLTIVGGLAAAFGVLSSSQAQAATSAQDVADAWNNAKDAAKGLRDAGLAVVQAKLDEVQASRAQQAAQNAVNKLTAEGKTHTQAYKDATLTLKQAQLSHVQASNAVKDATDNVKKAQQDETKATQDAIQKDKTRISTIQTNISWLTAVGGHEDKLRSQRQLLASMTEKLGRDQSALNRAFGAMPSVVESVVKVSVDFLSNVPGAIAAIGAGAVRGIAGAVGSHATGGMVNQPGYFAGEEAPRHPEVILATNPAYRQRNVGLWQQAGGMLGIPGFAGGGVSYANAGREVRGIDPWAVRRADAYIAPVASAWAKRMLAAVGGGSAAGVGSLDGHPVDKWIIPILEWARRHGWSGSVTSGYRTPEQQLAAARAYGLGHYGPAGPLGSNHIKTSYPGGAVDVTGAGQLAAVLSAYPGRPNLVWGGPVMGDPVHFSATGFKGGGMFGAYNHQYPKHYTGTAGTQFAPNLVAKIAEWAGMPGVTMAQIAHGESSYMPGIVQGGQDYAHTGWGLWQITPGNSVPASIGRDEQLLNPLVNAKAAAWKYGRASPHLAPWYGTQYLTDPNKHYTGAIPGKGVTVGTHTSVPHAAASHIPSVAPPQRGNPAAIALRGPLGQTARWISGMSGIPSQSTGGQIQLAQLGNALTLAQNAGDVTGQKSALYGQMSVERIMLQADKIKLGKINRALRNRKLSRKGRATLLADKLALIQEIGSLQGNMGSQAQSLADLNAGGATDTTVADGQAAYTAAIEAQTQALGDLTTALNANVHYMASVGAVETSQAIKALSDVISGQIGGLTLSRQSGSAGDGSVARYGRVGRA